MSDFEQIEIKREWIHQASEIARKCSSEATRQRVLVSQTAALAVGDYLHRKFNLTVSSGRSSDAKFTELLDVCDFRCHQWNIEMRTIMAAKNSALFVPTMPLMVGIFSDFYLCIQVDQNLSQASLYGYATDRQLNNAELTPNGMFAVLSTDELTPIPMLASELRKEKPTSANEQKEFYEWEQKASRILTGLNELLSRETFNFEQKEKIAAVLYDEILLAFGNDLEKQKIFPLLRKLFEHFEIEPLLPSAPEKEIAFRNSSKTQNKLRQKSERQKFFTKKLTVEKRVNLYRYLLENNEAFNEHRRTKKIFDHITDGDFQTSPLRQSRKRLVQRKIEPIWVEPPAKDAETEQDDKIEANSEKKMITIEQLQPNTIIRGNLLPEPVEIITALPMGDSVKIIGKGLNTNQVRQPIFNAEQLSTLSLSAGNHSFDGDSFRFKTGIEALRLSLAYEYDPYFALSIARVDPLPHQLEAVYDYFLKMPRIRFLLADDPGAGKTIMAGLLLKELKIRGLAKRVLIVTPANLTFQWQREMKDKFRENFDIVNGEILRANYGSNPWQEKNQVVTSVSWVSMIEDAKNSLLRSHWDLIIVDEAHKMSAYSSDKKTLAYQLGENLSKMTDHFLLMTATPHKGDPKNFCLFLELLDKDVYGDVKSLEEAMRRNNAPFYLRRIKESLRTFPDAKTGEVKKLFTDRYVKTAPFQINAQELELYDALSNYVFDQSTAAAQDDTARGRIIGFTMAMLQRRFASSTYALRRSLERMSDKRQKILDDPEAYRQEQINKKLPDDFEELPDDEQQKLVEDLEAVVASVDPYKLREEIQRLSEIIDQAKVLEQSEVETKLTELRKTIENEGVFRDPNMKLLIFTEHKDTLDFLVGKLREWNLKVTQIHGRMKIGDRDTPGSRIYAEREFKEDCQIMVATEAAGEGINLQFCWFMINYDIPWNPVRLEQRMGRIHRYGQEKDCLIYNFVSTNTREGRVLEKLLDRLLEIRSQLGSDSVFDVIGEIFPSNLLEKMFRDMYSRNTSEQAITDRIVKDVDVEKIRQITESALEGLAKRDLNLSQILGKHTEAKERRLVPEVIEDFFVKASPLVGIVPKETVRRSHVYRVGKVPRSLWNLGSKLESRFGKLGHEYKQVVFDKELAKKDITTEWVTPGHPLFEVVREKIEIETREHLERGAVFYDLNTQTPYRLDVFLATIKDGLGNDLHKRLYAVQVSANGEFSLTQPTIFLDLAIAPEGVKPTNLPNLPDRNDTEYFLVENALHGLLEEVSAQRTKEVETIKNHIEISLNELIHRQNLRMVELEEERLREPESSMLAPNFKQTEDRIEELNERLETRTKELEQERQCSIGGVQFVGSAIVLPHPERENPNLAPMVRDEEIERIAIQTVIAEAEREGWIVESVESENRGFDLILRKFSAEDARNCTQVRFVEVKGRAGVGEVGLSSNEFKTAERLRDDFWLYVVYKCANEPELHKIQNPARLGWQPVVRVEQYHISSKEIIAAEKA